jgi:hypothetical protein
VRDEDDPRPTPPSVVTAVAFGTAPVPFIAVYAVLFIVHGTVHPVVPPDITSSKQGELVAGIIAAVLFLISLLALVWVVNGHRRWPFALIQAGMLGTAVFFLIDGSEGGALWSTLVAVASAAALVFVFLPSAWVHFDVPLPGQRLKTGPAAAPRSRPSPAGSAPVSDSTPTGTRLAGGSREN